MRRFLAKPPALPLAEREAVAWLARERSGAMTDEETAALKAWLAADPVHRRAFDKVVAAFGRFELVREAPQVLSLRARAHGGGFMTRRRAGMAMAAGLAAAVAGLGLQQAGLIGFREYPDQTFRTEIGQRSTVTLPDGSVVTLNTGTVLRTRRSPDKRLLYLDEGQAFFKVAKDPRHPFIVHAAGRTVTALGTAFDVRAENGQFAVTLVEGKVKVATPPPAPEPAARAVPAAGTATGRAIAPSPAPVQAVELLPGNQFTALDDTRWSVARTDVEAQTTWLTGWLKFRNRPLGEVAAEFGRYSTRRIVIDDAELARRPITGRFQAEDIDAFVRALETYHIARARSETAEAVHLAALE